MRSKSGCIVWAIMFLSLPLSAQEIPARPLTVFLVRHAEKVDASRDPELSALGTARAAQLANVLRDAELKQIHSSDYLRTRATAKPLADRLEREVKLYDPTDLPALVAKLREAGGRHLVVGHSTTTPKVVELLGGAPGKPIDEAGEFDRLYMVTVQPSGRVQTVLLRYGRPFQQDGPEQDGPE